MERPPAPMNQESTANASAQSPGGNNNREPMKVVLSPGETMSHGREDGPPEPPAYPHGHAGPNADGGMPEPDGLLPPPPRAYAHHADPHPVPPRRVDHTYRDYSRFPAGEVPPGKAKAPMNFPRKLHRILSTPEFAHVSFFRRPNIWHAHDRGCKLSYGMPNRWSHPLSNRQRRCRRLSAGW